MRVTSFPFGFETFSSCLAQAFTANCICEIPCLSPRWVRSLITIHKLSNNENKNLDKARIQTRGWWVRSANATSVICLPPICLQTYFLKTTKALPSLITASIWISLPAQVPLIRRADEQDVQPGPRDGAGDRWLEAEVPRQAAAHLGRHGPEAEAATELLRNQFIIRSPWVSVGQENSPIKPIFRQNSTQLQNFKL